MRAAKTASNPAISSVGGGGGREAEAQRDGLPGRDVEPRPGRALGAAGADCRQIAGDDTIVDPVLDQPGIGPGEQPLVVGVVLAEQEVGGLQRLEPPRLVAVAHRRHAAVGIEAQRGARRADVPRPDVARPQMRQDVQRRRVGPAIVDDDAHQDVVGVGLGVVDRDVEIALLVEQAGVDQLIFGQVAALAARALLDKVVIGEGSLRIFVEHPHVGMRRRAIEIPVELLHVLAVIALLVGEAEHALLEDRIATVPQREGRGTKAACRR